MKSQPDLFDFANPNSRNLREKAEKWIRDNPHVYDLYKRFALELLQKGKRFSISLITERIRWECYFQHNSDFKISNDFRAYIARKLVEDIPELKKIFKFKSTRW